MTEYINKIYAQEIVKNTKGDYATAFAEIRKLPAVELAEVQGKLICDPLTVDKPEAIGPEVRRKAREALMEELEKKGLIRYQMVNGILYTGIRVAAPEKKT